MKDKKVQNVDSIIETLMKSYLGRKHVKSIDDLNDEEVNKLFNEMKKVMSEFSDFDEQLETALENKRSEILENRVKIKKEEFIKSFRKDRALLSEGIDTDMRLKIMNLENLKKRNISVKSTKNNEVIKLNPNISKIEKPATLPLKEALKIETLQPLSIVNEGILIDIFPKGSLDYSIDTVDGSIQKYRLHMKNTKNGKTDVQYVYTNAIDEELYKKDKVYREKLRYLLSPKNIKNSKKLKGYIGEITLDNRVVDDPISFAAILKREQDIQSRTSMIDKFKRNLKGNKNDGRE